jgi:hypothetical protein
MKAMTNVREARNTFQYHRGSDSKYDLMGQSTISAYSWCNSSFSESLGWGTTNQQTAVTAINDTRTGWSTDTPNLVLRRPVIIGKREPPICATTNTMESAVDLVSDGNNLDPTDIA